METRCSQTLITTYADAIMDDTTKDNSEQGKSDENTTNGISQDVRNQLLDRLYALRDALLAYSDMKDMLGRELQNIDPEEGPNEEHHEMMIMTMEAEKMLFLAAQRIPDKWTMSGGGLEITEGGNLVGKKE